MAAGPPDVPPQANARKNVLVLATGWGPQFGGINALNIDLCQALGQLLKGVARVFCLTTPVDKATRADASSHGVELLTCGSRGGGNSERAAHEVRDVLKKLGVERLDLIIGHDVFTGPVAIALRFLMGTVAVVIHHMSYGDYQAVKADGQTGHTKQEAQRAVLLEADVVCAVGPLLKRSAESLVQRSVTMLVPGLAEIAPIEFRDKFFRAITFGRLGGEDDRIKQGPLAAAAYGRFVLKVQEFDLEQELRFNLFGLAKSTYEAEEKALRELVNGEAKRVVNVFACPYTESRRELFAALAENEVALMLSWHEGFGLVGWEAIAAGVPLIVSQASGLYELLRDGFGADSVYGVCIRGSEEDAPNEEDIEAVAKMLLKIAVKVPDALAKAQKLRNYLRNLYTWERCARELLVACGWESLLPVPLGAAPSDLHSGLAGRTVPRPRSDIDTLRAYTRETLGQQARFAMIQASGTIVKVQRACVNKLVSAAKEGSLLIVGEPGAGKSGAQYDAVTALLAAGADVVVLAAEGLAADSLGELRTELGVEGDLLSILDGWPGNGPAYLVIDALDAARSEGVAQTLRDLMRSVIGRNGRWRVIASIRKFDLRYSFELRRMVSGAAVADFADPEFTQVRHLKVPVLDDDELAQVAAQSNNLQTVLATAGAELRPLLRVPFHLSLVAAILADGIPAAELTPIRTQIELLDRYWETRVIRSDRAGETRESLLRTITEEMVRRRSLRAPRSVVAHEPLRDILSANVLIEWQTTGASRPEQALLAFSHHLLFDYAVARLLFRGEHRDLVRRLEAEPDLALFARPSVVLHFHHVWVAEPSRTVFWDLVATIQQSETLSEIAKTIGPMVVADLFTTPQDFSRVVEGLGGDQ